MAVILQRGNDDGRVVGRQRGQDRLMPVDAVAGTTAAGLFADVHRHRQLQLQQYRLQREVELAVVGEPHHGRMELPVGVVAVQIIGGATHQLQCGAYRPQRHLNIRQRQCRLDRVALQHLPQSEELQNVRG